MSQFLPVDPKEVGRWIALASVGLEMVVPIGLGWLLDRYAGMDPWGVIGGVVVGFVGGVVHLMIMVNLQERRDRQKTSPPRKRAYDRRLALLVLGCLSAWGALAYPAWLVGGKDGVLQSAVAAGVCLVPAALSLLWGRRALRRGPEQVFLLLTGGLVLRIALVFAAAIVLSIVVPGLRHREFWLWIVIFYLVTLALDMALLLWGHAAPRAPSKRIAPAKPG